MTTTEEVPAELLHVADDGSRWTVGVVLPAEGQPLVRISGPAAPTLRMDYYVTTVMESVLQGRGFVFGWEDHLFRFSPVAIAAIAKEVIETTPGTAGAYAVTWSPNDPTVPF